MTTTITRAPDHAELVAFAVRIMGHVSPADRYAEAKHLAADEPGSPTGTRLQAVAHLFWTSAASIASIHDCMTGTGRISHTKHAEALSKQAHRRALDMLHALPELAACLRHAMEMFSRDFGPCPASVPVEATRSGTTAPHHGTPAGSSGTATGIPAPFTYRHRSRG